MMDIKILGRSIELELKEKSKLKGISIGDSIEYTFYEGAFRGMSMLFLKPRKANPSPRTCSLTSARLSERLGLPIVFILTPGPSYERQRLIDKDVFFIMGDKYANLPMLVANERVRTTPPAKRLTPVAQYLLLYHLQVENIEGQSARTMTDKLPYSYESITLGLTCLSDLGLIEKVAKGSKSKVVHFTANGRQLWEKAKPYFIDPVAKRLYCDELRSEEEYPTCSINALAHYSWLNPDETRMVMMNRKQLQVLQNTHALYNENEYDGNVMIEVWKYPPVTKQGVESLWVDRLSLVLSLRKNNDPRVEGEVERVINETKWLD